MASPAPTVLNAIDALFITLYNRVADYNDYTGFASSLGLTVTQAASTTATVAQFETLAAAMTGPNNSAAVLAYYNTNYGSLNPVQFITALYNNLGGPTNQAGIAPGVTYWSGLILGGQSYTQVLGQFVDAFLTYTGTDPVALARQATLDNKVAVSEYYALESETNSFLIPTTPSGPAFQAVQNVIANVTSSYASVVAAEAEITAAVAQHSLQPLLNIIPVLGQVYTLTIGQDGPVGFTDSAGHATFNAPLAGIFGNQPTLTNGDNLVANASVGGNVLNAEFNGGNSGIQFTGGTSTSSPSGAGNNVGTSGGVYTASGLNITGIETWNIQSTDTGGTIYLTGDAAIGNVISGVTTLNFNGNSGTASLIIGDNAEPVQEVAGAFSGGNVFTVNVSNLVGVNSAATAVSTALIGGTSFVSNSSSGFPNGVDIDFAASVFTGKDTIDLGVSIVGGFPEVNGSYIIPQSVIVAPNDGDNYNPNWAGYLGDSYSISAGASAGGSTLNGIAPPSTGAVGFQNWVISSTGAASVGSVNIIALGNEGSWNAQTLTLTDDGSTTILFATSLSDSLSTDWMNLASINLSGTSGYVVITGAETDAQLYGSGSSSTSGWVGGGLLTSDTTALETITGGTGNSFYDLSSLTLAAIQAFGGKESYQGGSSIHGNSEVSFNNFVVANAPDGINGQDFGTQVNISHIQVLDDTGGLYVNGIYTDDQGGFIDLSHDFSGLAPLNTPYALLAGSPLSGVFPSPLDPSISVTGGLYANDIVPVGFELLQLLNADGSTKNFLGSQLTIKDGFTDQAINAQDLADGGLTWTVNGDGLQAATFDAVNLIRGSGVTATWTGWDITIEGELATPTVPANTVNQGTNLLLWVSDDGISNLFQNAGTATALYVPDLTIDNYTTVNIYLPYESVGNGHDVQDYVILGGAAPVGSPLGAFGFNDNALPTVINASVSFYDNTADNGGSPPGGPDDLVLGYTDFTGVVTAADIGLTTVSIDATTGATTLNDFGHGSLEIGATNVTNLNAQSTSHLIMDVSATLNYLLTDSIAEPQGITVFGSATGQNLIQGTVGGGSPAVGVDGLALGHTTAVLEVFGAPFTSGGIGNDVLTGGADTALGFVVNSVGNGGDNFFPLGGNDIVNIGSAGNSVKTDSTVWLGAFDLGNNGGPQFGVTGSAGGADWGVGTVVGQAITDGNALSNTGEVFVDNYGSSVLTINNFFGPANTTVPTGNTIVFDTADWANTGTFGTHTLQGLTQSDGVTVVGAGFATYVQEGTANTVLTKTADVILDTIAPAYANATALTNALTDSAVGNLVLAGTGVAAGHTADFLVAYNLSSGGLAIADVTFANNSGLTQTSTAAAGVVIHVQDLVHIAGTGTLGLSNLIAHNIDFL